MMKNMGRGLKIKQEQFGRNPKVDVLQGLKEFAKRDKKEELLGKWKVENEIQTIMRWNLAQKYRKRTE